MGTRIPMAPIFLFLVFLAGFSAAQSTGDSNFFQNTGGDYTYSSNDLCSNYTSCFACSAYGCGWCEASKQCLPGGSTGPSTGSCDNGWNWIAFYCPSSQSNNNNNNQGNSTIVGMDYCSYQSSCGNCLSSYGCGWCASSNQCMSGSSSGSGTGSCTYMNGWTTTQSECPAENSVSSTGSSSPDAYCSQYSSCSSCQSQASCGWCDSTQSCMTGIYYPYYGYCSYGWKSFQDQCTTSAGNSTNNNGGSSSQVSSTGSSSSSSGVSGSLQYLNVFDYNTLYVSINTNALLSTVYINPSTSYLAISASTGIDSDNTFIVSSFDLTAKRFSTYSYIQSGYGCNTVNIFVMSSTYALKSVYTIQVVRPFDTSYDYPVLDSLTINGAALSGFFSHKFNYYIDVRSWTDMKIYINMAVANNVDSNSTSIIEVGSDGQWHSPPSGSTFPYTVNIENGVDVKYIRVVRSDNAITYYSFVFSTLDESNIDLAVNSPSSYASSTASSNSGSSGSSSQGSSGSSSQASSSGSNSGSDSCSVYSSCGACTLSSSCGWCGATQSCQTGSLYQDSSKCGYDWMYSSSQCTAASNANSALSSISVYGTTNTLSPGFQRTTTSYTLSVEAAVNYVSFVAAPANSLATVKFRTFKSWYDYEDWYDGSSVTIYAASGSSSYVAFWVKSADGSTSTIYYIQISKAYSPSIASDQLQAFTIYGSYNSFTPSFSSDVYQYSVDLPSYVDLLTFVATPASTSANVYFGSYTTDRYSATWYYGTTITMGISYGKSYLDCVVYSPGWSSYHTYTLELFRANSNSNNNNNNNTENVSSTGSDNTNSIDSSTGSIDSSTGSDPGSICSAYTSCFECASNNYCGWCTTNSQCQSHGNTFCASSALIASVPYTCPSSASSTGSEVASSTGSEIVSSTGSSNSTNNYVDVNVNTLSYLVLYNYLDYYYPVQPSSWLSVIQVPSTLTQVSVYAYPVSYNDYLVIVSNSNLSPQLFNFPQTIQIDYGCNTALVFVFDPSTRQAKGGYVMQLIKELDIAHANNPVLNSLSINGMLLPKFSSQKFNYFVNTSFLSDFDITFSASVSDSYNTVIEYTKGSYWNPLTSGSSAFKRVELLKGIDVLGIRLTRNDGAVTHYSILFSDVDSYHANIAYESSSSSVESSSTGSDSGVSSTGSASSDPCNQYSSCSSCEHDASCGWCGATSTCMTGFFTPYQTCVYGWTYYSYQCPIEEQPSSTGDSSAIVSSSTGSSITNTNKICPTPILHSACSFEDSHTILVFSTGTGDNCYHHLGYRVVIDGVEQSLLISGSTYQLYHLENGQAYRISIVAVYLDGKSLPSNAITVIPATVPSAPSFTVETDDGRAFVTVVPAFDGGVTITKYRLYIDGIMSKTVDVADLGREMKFTVNNLSNNVNYIFNLTAVNAVGESRMSSPVMVKPDSATVTYVRQINCLSNYKPTQYQYNITLNPFATYVHCYMKLTGPIKNVVMYSDCGDGNKHVTSNNYFTCPIKSGESKDITLTLQQFNKDDTVYNIHAYRMMPEDMIQSISINAPTTVGQGQTFTVEITAVIPDSYHTFLLLDSKLPTYWSNEKGASADYSELYRSSQKTLRVFTSDLVAPTRIGQYNFAWKIYASSNNMVVGQVTFSVQVQSSLSESASTLAKLTQRRR